MIQQNNKALLCVLIGLLLTSAITGTEESLTPNMFDTILRRFVSLK